MNRIGMPCESARPTRHAPTVDAVEMCGNPSHFLYTGLTADCITDRRRAQRLGVNRVSEAGRYQRGTLLLCPDCAYNLSHNMAEALIKGKARLERLDVVKFRAHCTACDVTVHVAWDTDAPSTNPGTHVFCPRCGHKTMFRIDPDADYWDIIAESFPMMPVQLLQMLHVEWPHNDRRFPTFRSYVEFQVQHSSEEGELMEV